MDNVGTALSSAHCRTGVDKHNLCLSTDRQFFTTTFALCLRFQTGSRAAFSRSLVRLATV